MGTKRETQFPDEWAIAFALEWLRTGHEPPQTELLWVADWLEAEQKRRNFERTARGVAKQVGCSVATARRHLRRDTGPF